MRFDKRILFAIRSALFVCLCLFVGPASADRPQRPPPDWAFVGRSDLAELPVARVVIATVAPEEVAKAIGIPRVVRPSPAAVPPQPEAIRAAVMKPLDSNAARVVVDLDNRTVSVRRGDDQLMLPIEVRNAGASAKTIAEVARAGTADPWVVPYSVIVDGDHVGLRMKDGDSFLDPSYLEPELRQQTERSRRGGTVIAAR